MYDIEGFEPPFGAWPQDRPLSLEDQYRTARADYERAQARGSADDLHNARRWLTNTYFRWRADHDEPARRRWRWRWAIERRREALWSHVERITRAFKRERFAAERLARECSEKGKPYSPVTLGGLRRERSRSAREHDEMIEQFRAFLAQPCPGYHDWRRAYVGGAPAGPNLADTVDRLCGLADSIQPLLTGPDVDFRDADARIRWENVVGARCAALRAALNELPAYCRPTAERHLRLVPAPARRK